MLGVSPLMVWAITTPAIALGLPAGLREALILMAASSPIISNIAIALFVGLDAALAAVVVVFSTALVPFTLPPLALALLDLELAISLPAFMARLAALVGGAFAAAWLVRRLVPHRNARRLARTDRRPRRRESLRLRARHHGRRHRVRAASGRATRLLAIALAFAFNLLLQAAGWLAFRRHGAVTALTVALMSGNCNMGLVLVALSGHVDIEVTAFFALAQVPMYMLPVLLEPLYRRARAQRRDVRIAGSGASEVK